MGTRKLASHGAVNGDAGHKPSPKLAKLTRPQASNAVLRDRLFTSLDEAQERPIVWIHGPPGAGKTTLLASYLNAKKRSGIWYQIDSDDGDPASFFYYLGLAATAKAPRKRRPMPLLTPEYLLDIEGFTRRFFRELCARLGDTAVLVLDNYQEVAAPSVFHKVIACALSELAPGTRVIVLSRTEPPPEYARHLANSLIAQMGWDDLRLTMDETRLIATARQPVNAELLQNLHEQSDGWAAGLVLMLERLKQTGAVNHVAQPETLETVFNYFAGEILEQLSASTREFLIRTSMVPRVTAELANTLTGRSDAASVLGKLHKRQLFIDRRVGDTFTYQYHALFRLFLQAQAKKYQTEAEWKALVVASAEALVTHGQLEEAVPLFVAGAAWEPAIRLIVTHAQTLLAFGRWQTLQRWIESVPEAIQLISPWLRFWLGMCRLRVDPANARTHLEPAFEMFQKEDDKFGQALTATAIIETYVTEWIDYSRFDPWIAALETLLTEGEIPFPSLDAELVVRASLFHAIVQRQSYREDLFDLAKQLAAMLRHALDPNYKLFAARALFFYSAYSGNFALAEEVAGYTKSAFNAPGASPMHRAWYLTRRAFGLRYIEPADKVRALFTQARELARNNGLRFMEVPIATLWAWSEDVFGDVTAMERELSVIKEHLDPARRFEVAFRDIVMAFLSTRYNELDVAIMHFQEALAFFRRSSSTIPYAFTLHALSAVFSDRKRMEEAHAALAEALPLMIPGSFTDYIGALSQAGLALRLKDEDIAKEKLEFALQLAVKHRFETTLSEHCYSRICAELCAFALKHRIEIALVKRIVRRHRLHAPSPEIEDWPWPVRIRALGGFSLEIEDRPASFSGKAPKKPLELLKALVASGGTEVDIGWLGEQLWPDAEADAARSVFNVTHSRLRKLLPLDDVLMLREGKLRLNPAYVWTDVWAFERVVADCLEKLRRNVESLEIESASETLLSLYSGDLLKGEPDSPWLIAARDRLRSKFLRTLKPLGGFWEANEAWDKAQSLYERVLEIDNVAEEVYRRLMGCYARAGRPAEALRAYRRCRQMLSVVLGIAPSAETETLYRSIAQAQ